MGFCDLKITATSFRDFSGFSCDFVVTFEGFVTFL